jgi:SAM-dependent methyltransferase
MIAVDSDHTKTLRGKKNRNLGADQTTGTRYQNGSFRHLVAFFCRKIAKKLALSVPHSSLRAEMLPYPSAVINERPKGADSASPAEMTGLSDLNLIHEHRKIWVERPELRDVYRDWFARLLRAAGKRSPVVELGAGPGFFKEYFPELIATDVIATRWVDVVCDGCAMPFPTTSVGALVMLDVLHHLPYPLEFLNEAARVLTPGGVVAMIEPWITPASYLFWRFFHQEDCILASDIQNPFGSQKKNAFDGNIAIPYNLVRHSRRTADVPLRLVRLEPFLALPYLVTFGFQRTRPMSPYWSQTARICERMLGRIGRWNSTRALLVWQKQENEFDQRTAST